MEDIDRPRGEGHFRVTGGGIDRNKLLNEQEIEFGVEVEDIIKDEDDEYFDRETVFKNLNFDCTDEGDDDSDANSDMTPFQRMAVGMEDITPTKDGGVLKKVLVPGVGNLVPNKATVKVHYNAYLEYSEEPFDSSILRNSLLQIKHGSGEQIFGWEIALVTMRKNEKARYLFAAPYAYGKMGCPPRIPANATVMFEIEVKSFVDAFKADEFETTSKEEKQKMTFHEILCVVDSLRQRGNDEFNNKKLTKALRTYKMAIQQLETCRLANEEEENAMKKNCLTLYLNASLCSLRLGNWRNAAYFSRKALHIDTTSVKAYYRLGKALGQMAEFTEARKHLLNAQALAPSNKEVREELKKLNANYEEFQQMGKTISAKMFSQPPLTQEKLEKTKKGNEDEENERKMMLGFIESKIRAFKTDQSQDILHLPPLLKEEELEAVNSLAKSEGFKIENDENGIPCVKKK
ncbi:inactive peptidyl-prolyl cis-trans isomerase FKBP6-like [Rhopilema esculentum]|uniref:inactive peptidyl-prolyl cis-trans isomerase FKBP6-like n=1 Tax=Rhopilema esculentum TaxID=499914 RepID=UPI0031D9E503|eukprot:gene15105-6285_t